jgi:hypothetical protein
MPLVGLTVSYMLIQGSGDPAGKSSSPYFSEILKQGRCEILEDFSRESERQGKGALRTIIEILRPVSARGVLSTILS